MAVKIESNKISEIAELVLDSTSVGFAVAGLGNPLAGFIAPLINILALPFAAHNYSFIKKKINEIIVEVNKHEIRLDKIEKISNEQSVALSLNGYKFFDYCLKEKMKAKIGTYAKIFANSINDGSALEENDDFDIKMDIINSLRSEDIELLNGIITYFKSKGNLSFAGKFSKNDLKSIICLYSKHYNELNEYALRHLINLGLVSETVSVSLPNVAGEKLTFDDKILYKYSLTERCKIIYKAIVV